MVYFGWPWIPCHLRRRSEAALLLGSQVQTPLRPWTSSLVAVGVFCRPLRRADISFIGVLPRASACVCMCMCLCVCVCLIVCDLETSIIRQFRPELSCCATGIKIDTLKGFHSFAKKKSCCVVGWILLVYSILLYCDFYVILQANQFSCFCNSK
jgi:hypothetical protein